MKRVVILVLFAVLLSDCGRNQKNKADREHDSLMNIAVEKWKEDAEAKVEDEIIGVGTITSIADGFDVQRVNIWSSTNGSTRTMKGYFSNNEKVNVLKDEDPYYLIEAANKDGRRGYVMKGFVKNITKAKSTEIDLESLRVELIGKKYEAPYSLDLIEKYGNPETLDGTNNQIWIAHFPKGKFTITMDKKTSIIKEIRR